MSHLDTDNKFYCMRQSATEESLGSIQMRRLKDGSLEVIAEESTKKWDGKRWHTNTAYLTLTKEQAAKLAEVFR